MNSVLKCDLIMKSIRKKRAKPSDSVITELRDFRASMSMSVDKIVSAHLESNLQKDRTEGISKCWIIRSRYLKCFVNLKRKCLKEMNNYSFFRGWEINLLEGNLRNSLNTLWDNKTRNLPMKLRLGFDMHMYTSPHLNLCNGSIGHIVYIHHYKNVLREFIDFRGISGRID
jgi:hypothetical protein